VVPASPTASRRRHPPSPSPRRSPRRSDDGAASTSRPTSRRLEDMRRLRCDGVSDAAFRLISASWRPSSTRRYDGIWDAFRDFLRARALPLSSVTLRVVLDYFSDMFDRGRAFRTIRLHRSVLSSTLPPFDGHSVGDHPLVSRLIQGIFQRRPPSRRLYDSWNVGRVFDFFASWSSPLSFEQLQRKTAFLLAMASSKRPSELSSIRCSSAFMVIDEEKARFLPSCLSKTDRQRHLGAAFSIARLPVSSDASVCPVEVLETYLRRRAELHVPHDYVFCGFRAPRDPLSTAAFSDRLRWVMRHSGIIAPPGSTRATSVSDAFARGDDLAAVLRAGDWSRAGLFFRHYLRSSVASVGI
jgi:hypothetical protein